jgi:transcriptional regulator with XRE-family HTH domain
MEPIYEVNEAAIGEALRLIRQDEGRSLRAVAARTGVSAATISRIEKGKVLEASFGAVLALCNEYGESLDELLDANLMSEASEVRDELHVLRVLVLDLIDRLIKGQGGLNSLISQDIIDRARIMRDMNYRD